LKSTGREDYVDLADAVAGDLRADDEVLSDPGSYFDQVIEIDLDDLRPLINGPHTPDRARPVNALGAEAEAEGWPKEISYALVRDRRRLGAGRDRRLRPADRHADQRRRRGDQPHRPRRRGAPGRGVHAGRERLHRAPGRRR